MLMSLHLKKLVIRPLMHVMDWQEWEIQLIVSLEVVVIIGQKVA